MKKVSKVQRGTTKSRAKDSKDAGRESTVRLMLTLDEYVRLKENARVAGVRNLEDYIRSCALQGVG